MIRPLFYRHFLNHMRLPFVVLSVAFFLGACGTVREIETDPPHEPQESFGQPSIPKPPIVTATASLTQASSPLAAISQEESLTYILGPEDMVQVLVWKDEALTRTVMIRPDGKISLPLVGELQAAGLTPNQLSNNVRAALKKYYKEQPEVSTIVTEINSFSVFVLGQVVIPGKHILRRETTVLQILSLAGGFKEYANTKKILLLRRHDSVETRILINYKNLVSGEGPDENLMLQSGDTIIVP
ncbi:MAG: polysaccharide biosynthesis/export family protein [Nitrospirota bacterium]